MAPSLLSGRSAACVLVAIATLVAGCGAARRQPPVARATTPRTSRSAPPARPGGRVTSPHAATTREGGPSGAGRGPAPAIAAVPPAPGAQAGVPAGRAAALRDDDAPLTAKIDRTTAPRRAAALRLTEQAREHLARDDVPRAIELLERAVAVDARSPYAYYFLAEAHAQAKQRALARSFAARAEQLFTAEPYWRARTQALRGRLAEEEGRTDEARAAYARALATWPRNGDAVSGLARLTPHGQGAP